MKSVFIEDGEQVKQFPEPDRWPEVRELKDVAYWYFNFDEQRLRGYYCVFGFDGGLIGWRLDEYTADDPDDRIVLVTYRVSGELP